MNSNNFVAVILGKAKNRQFKGRFCNLFFEKKGPKLGHLRSNITVKLLNRIAL